jgi:molybdopterin synthase catalytic subunit
VKENRVNNKHPSVETWLDEIKSASDSKDIGIFFIHNGVVRGTTRGGVPVSALDISCNHERLARTIAAVEDMPGVVAARAWINEGTLNVGDDMIYALVAGDIRKNVFPAWETLVRRIKSEVIVAHETLETGSTRACSVEETV